MATRVGRTAAIAASVLLSSCGAGEAPPPVGPSASSSPASVTSAAPANAPSSLSEQDRLLKETGLLLRTEAPPAKGR
jgi:hypothetical protein